MEGPTHQSRPRVEPSKVAPKPDRANGQNLVDPQSYISPAAVLQLQRTAGNAAVARLLAGPYGSPVPRPTTEVVQRNAQDVLPPPMAVTWGSDPFLMSFARSASGDRLEVTVRYQGTHPF